MVLAWGMRRLGLRHDEHNGQSQRRRPPRWRRRAGRSSGSATARWRGQVSRALRSSGYERKVAIPDGRPAPSASPAAISRRSSRSRWTGPRTPSSATRTGSPNPLSLRSTGSTSSRSRSPASAPDLWGRRGQLAALAQPAALGQGQARADRRRQHRGSVPVAATCGREGGLPRGLRPPLELLDLRPRCRRRRPWRR